MNGNHTAVNLASEKRSWEGIFHFNPEDDIYREHFPGYPVVPGSLIVHAFMKAAAKIGFSSESLTIENFQFREFLRPGSHRFRVELKKNKLHCSIMQGDKKMATGILSK